MNLLAWLATPGLLVAALVSVTHADEPYKRMLDDEMAFTGTETLPAEDSGDEIVIGLFAPDDEDHPVGRAMVRGATLAVDQANAAGGIDGRRIRLVRRWANDPWGAGSKEVIKLVYEDHAWALIGGPDGASTHIAQQVATKAHIPLIAPVSSDPTLTQTRVPWIFRLAPDDAVQAHALIDGPVNDRNLKKFGLITATDHDSRTTATELIAALENQGIPPVFHLEISTSADELAVVVRRAAAFEPDGLILRVPRTVLRPLAEALGSHGLVGPLFLPWIPGALPGRFPLSYPGEVVWLEPFDSPQSCGAALKLERAFIARHGERPTPAAVYGHDAARLIIEGLTAGADGRVELRDAIAATADFNGSAGLVTWDHGGGNDAARPVPRSR